MKMEKLKFGFYWAASCGGCEIAVLDIDEKILDVLEVAEVVFWPVAMDIKYRDVEAMPDDPAGHYKLATLYAGRRKSGSAFMKLRRALELNHAQTLQWIRADMEWDRYRDTRKFKALLDDTKPN